LFNYLLVYLWSDYPQMKDRLSLVADRIIAHDARCVNQVMQVVAALP